MITEWTRHLHDPEDKQRFETHILSSRAVLERLSAIIDERLRAVDFIETGTKIYGQAGWDALLAHYNGQKSALKLVKQIINLDQKENINE